MTVQEKYNTEKIQQISQVIQQKILAVQTPEELQKVKKEYLSKGGIISQIFNQTIKLNNSEERKERIKFLNQRRDKLITISEKKEQELTEKALNQQLLKEKIDPTLEGKKLPLAY